MKNRIEDRFDNIDIPITNSIREIKLDYIKTKV